MRLFKNLARQLQSTGFGLRAFSLYFVILGGIIWFTLGNAIERLNDGMRQSAESVLVDVAHIMAGLIEQEVSSSEQLQTREFKEIFAAVKQKQFLAQIYQVRKTHVDMEIYVTDRFGKVVYDSTGLSVGEDFSNWRDVQFTLRGEYGARTSYIDQNRREPEDPQAMYVAAPIKSAAEIIGVVTVMKPVESLNGHLLTGTQQLQRYAFALLALALLIGFLLSLWFTKSLQAIANYADDMAAGKTVTPPNSPDARLTSLSRAISNLRSQLDGKQYVENYIHGLTHELKTPITSIQGAVELIDENMPSEDRQRFLDNIQNSNQRMARLVERMLSLAKLESARDLQPSEFDLGQTLKRLLQEREQLLEQAGLTIKLPEHARYLCFGDRVLIAQAIANLLDNAIRFATPHSQLCVDYGQDQTVSTAPQHFFQVVNQGEAIPDYAMNKVFDRFFSLAPNDSQQSKSTGLGLSFAKQIMKLHNGEVLIKNVDKGVLAQISWPMRSN